MLSLIAAWVFTAQDSPRRRTLLDNNAAVFVERIPGEKRLSVQLVASVRGASETLDTHGWRHLLEHLILRGTDGKLDNRTESQGLFITGRTYRDALQIEVFGEPADLARAIEFALEPTKVRTFDAGVIKHEVEIMRQEQALQSDAQRLTTAAWALGFGSDGLEPFGNLETISLATPDALADLAERTFRTSNLTLSISGDVDLDRATKLAVEALNKLPVAKPVQASPNRGKGKAGRVEVPTAFGEALGVYVPSAWAPEFAATLVMAFAVTYDQEGAFVSYTPSNQSSLIVVGQTINASGFTEHATNLTDDDLAVRFDVAKNLALGWYRQQTASPAQTAWTRGLTLALSPNLKWEDLEESIRAVGWTKFKAKYPKFKRENAVVAVGTRS